MAGAFAELLQRPGGSASMELRFRHKDGSWRIMEGTGQNFLHDPAIQGIVINVRDVTERKRAEEELREREEKLRRMFESVSDGVAVADLEGTITELNRRAVEMHGAGGAAGVVGTNAFDLIAPSHRELAVAGMQRTLEHGTSGPIELDLVRVDGSEYPAELSASVLRDAAGEPSGFITTIRDVTERKRAEEELARHRFHLEELVEERTRELRRANERLRAEIDQRKWIEQALRQSEERFRTIVEGLPIAVSISRMADGSIVYVNQHFADIVSGDGASRGQLLGRSTAEFYADPGVRDRLLERLAAGERVRCEEIAGRRLDGSEFCVMASIEPLVFEGEEALMVGFYDITERKKAERKLRRLYERERELREQVEEEMGKRVEFTRALAHELKTPLTPVVMSSQILTSKLEDELLLRVAKNIERGASNLNSRIDELLDLARGEVGMLHIRPERVDLLELLREVVEEVSAVPASRGQRLVAKLPSGMPPVVREVSADRVRVKQVVMNLLNNAFKYTPEGGRITLRVRGDEGNVVVEVKDTGPGIEKGDVKRLFNPYHRIDSDRERLSGLGLGLALCKTLVELHGGRIWVKSRVGKGSTFGFSLPVGRGVEGGAAPEPRH
ncbi:MAG: PAS domain S-box protein, partial [Candidatus Latescibacterota bacterium]